jgi:hypothetical protein
MNIKRAFLGLTAALLMPALAMAGNGGPATFVVDFNFDDDNPMDPASVAHISCNGGLPLTSEQDVVHGSVITFVLDFPAEGAGTTDCDIWVDGVSGYTAAYNASGASVPSDDSAGCHYSEVDNDDENFCDVDMEIDPVTVFVTKDWEIDNLGSGDNTVETDIYIEASSDDPIEGGHDCYNGMSCVNLHFDGPMTDTASFQVTPVDGKTTVFLYEDIVDSAVESRNTCGNIFEGKKGKVTVYPGQGASCTFTNTVFFEGIPTLNQYGLAIMALLMLGVGFVGFRRFV